MIPGVVVWLLSYVSPDSTWPSSGPPALGLVLAKTPSGKWQGRLLGSSPRQREEFSARQERLLMELQRGTPS
jgi:hypothetical protein